MVPRLGDEEREPHHDEHHDADRHEPSDPLLTLDGLLFRIPTGLAAGLLTFTLVGSHDPAG
jgi:hypothetical protein